MSVFRVWAPRSRRVEVEIDGRTVAMHEAGAGWWQADIAQAGPGIDYAFRLDGGPPIPDPRSPWQPNGPMKPSRVLDHHAFAWSDRNWQSRPLSSAIIYELHTGTFTPEGTFEAIIGKLDYLSDLGITHIELMPINEFDGHRGWGYDGVAIFAPFHGYGGPVGLKRLVDACHAKGIGVILDVVYNHFGPSGCFLGQFGPYFTDRHKTPWGEAVNFDGRDSDEVRRFVIDNALMWLRHYHMDGLRLDGIHAILDSSAMHILEELAEEVQELSTRLGRHLFLIAESDLNDPRVVHSREVGGYGIDAQWSDDFHHTLHVTLTGERAGYYADFDGLPDLAYILQHAFLYDGRYSVFRGRRYGRPTLGLSGHRFLAYMQNHDQIGNRARGERISHLVNLDRVRMGAALVLTSPFVPMIFQGEEWAAGSPFQYFTGFEDPELGRAVREGRRSEFASFGWKPEDVPDPQSPDTFARSKLDWGEPGREPHASMLRWYRDLIGLRRRCGELSNGNMTATQTRCDERAGWLAVRRGHVALAFNFSTHPLTVPLGPGSATHVLLSSKPDVRLDGDSVHLPPETVVMLGPPG
ncbi:MAG TPA: malto-oligosyltrehalose trehalohydrolase [Phycisphaerae bacterium]|nr:malto-oligosyltrehalose trehalohydrolase [Phycisphaerae bacterium]HOM50871.1 malto-oligosyltrehalose trehalohydrolase [Phycisphaerae bacterium]HOQ86363.1 malto-oligosyltrehalose trehalohydrolase [Phycisphaerae bacterium]HPP25954.1 malto-oligosyltrehalose trehalohydrolase [Phycisphaerae bacterium]HPZ97206.1 malto-oligosyltrehalose trehalohydrolase [Phycisphaerae bacterium]